MEKDYQLRGKLRNNIPLSGYTTWRVGGPADRIYQPADLQDLANFIAGLPVTEPLLWIGLGSNLLIRDGGFRGTVIAFYGALAESELLSATRVQIGAGLSCARLARFLSRHKLTGGEFFSGIPGTIGGALATNAGAFGGQTWELVTEVTTMDRQGQLHQRTPADYQISYREIRLKNNCPEEWFVAACLQFQPATDDFGTERIRVLLNQRAQTQPIGKASAGSTFRNPPGDYAGRLIEASGLKGFCIGGACVSEIHANFIINTGNAQAADIENLIQHIQERVIKLHGVQLIPEVHIVGVG